MSEPERVVFSQVFESLVAALGPQLDLALAERFKRELSVDLAHLNAA